MAALGRRRIIDRPSSIVAPNLPTTIPLKRKWRRRPEAAPPPRRLEQVGLRQSSLESASASRACVRAAIMVYAANFG
jgi:hypothetical protein